MSELVDFMGKPYRITPHPGQWTLLYFWQTSCAPCVSEGIPKLMNFAKSHTDQRARFSIAAVHTNDPGQPQKDFLAKTLWLESNVWRGVPSFPLVLDESGKMTAAWSIESLPTIALIDGQGNLVRGGNLHKLEEVLASH